jgi:hypothetical protein
LQVRDVFKHVDTALALDSELVQHMQQRSQPSDPVRDVVAYHDSSSIEAGHSNVNEDGAKLPPAAADTASTAAVEDHAEDLQPLAEHLSQQVQLMHAQWRAALDARAVALTENYRMGDELRDARKTTHQAGQALAELQRDHGRVQGQLETSQVQTLGQDDSSSRRWAQCCISCSAFSLPVMLRMPFITWNADVSYNAAVPHMVSSLLAYACHCVQANAADLERRLLAAHDAVAKHLLELGDSEGQLANTRAKAESLEQRWVLQLGPHIASHRIHSGHAAVLALAAGVASWRSRWSSCSWTRHKRNKRMSSWSSGWQLQQAPCSASIGSWQRCAPARALPG